MTSATGSYTFRFIGWYKDVAENSDKVWGFIELNNADDQHRTSLSSWGRQYGSLYNFWGKRGKSLSFKRHYGRWGDDELHSLRYEKERKGYKEMSVDEMEALNPGFKEEFEKQFIKAKFSGRIKTDDTENNSFM